MLSIVLLAAGRTTYVSDYLKAIAIPELELMTGKKIIIGQIQVNLLPLFVELDETVVSDVDGTKLLSAARVKGYLSLSGLLNREVIVKRIAVNDVDAYMEEKQIGEIAGSIKKYLAVDRKDAYKVAVRSVILNKAFFDLRDGDNKVSVKAETGELLMSDKSSFNLNLHDFLIAVNDLPATTFSASSAFSFNRDTVVIKSLKINADGSELKVSGETNTGLPSGNFSTEAGILVESVKKFFGLKRKGDGKISVSGNFRIGDIKSPKDVFIDLKVKGNLYIETLMELLKVDERIEGPVTVDGEIKGPLNNLKGNALATMTNGNLFGVVVDSLRCNVRYADRKMTFSDADASIYGGTAKAEAMIALPVVNYYTFKVDAKGVSSKGVFELIGWDPGIADGKVEGQISSQGSNFNPHGIFSYAKSPGGKDVMERVQSVEGSFSMTDQVISFPKLHVSTLHSSILAAGLVDLKKKSLNLKAGGSSSDIYDLADPYFRAISGPASFVATISGSTLDPVLAIKFTSGDIKYLSGNMNLSDIMRPHSMEFSSVEGDVNYRKNILTVNNFSAVSRAMKIKTKGRIGFRKAKRLFDIVSPEYDLQISFDNGDLLDLSSIIRGAPAIKGTFHSVFILTGVGQQAVAIGTFRASDINLSDTYSLDRADAVLSFDKGVFNFKSLILKKGVGVMSAKGTISMDKHYSIAATLNALELRDALPVSWREKMGERNLKTLSLTDVSIQGRGTVANPMLDIKGLLKYRDPQREQSSGYGRVNIGIKGQDVSLSGNFMQGKVTISGAATLNDKLPWRADMAFQSARSDFIVALFLTDIPEDLLVNLKGDVKLWGDNRSINAVISLDKAYLYGYGYGFTNSRPVSVKLQDKLLTIESFAMKNELAELRISGSADFGKSYNLSMDGASSLAPLRSMSRNLDLLKGDASFALTLSGGWEKPRINGTMHVVNGALGIKNIPHRLTAVNARIVADGDRIVLEDASGIISGGSVTMSGAAYLDQLKLKRFFLDTRFTNVTIAVSKNFWVHSGGKLTYQGTLAGQNISGDVNISKARYTERVDWKSWLIQTRKNELMKIDLDKLDQTGLNVRVIGNNLSVDNNVMRAAMKMDILLKGTIGQPSILGRFESVNGIIYFRNNEFNLLKGVIDFARPGEIKPFFDVLAETRIKNYTVRFALDGYTDQFNLALSSTPTLEEGDILSLMAAGDIAKNLKGSSGGIGAGEATSFLTGKLQDVVEDRLKTITGLDRLQIDPSVSRTTGAVSPRLTISKRLIGDRFYATYSTAADVGEGQIIKLEYLLNKNISLVGVRDEIGGIGGDVKFRFQFK